MGFFKPKKWFSSAVRVVSNTVEDVVKPIAAAPSAIVQVGVALAEDVGNSVTNLASDAVDGVFNIAGDAVDGARDIVSDVIGGVDSVVSDIVEGANDITNDTLGGILDTVTDVGEGLGNVISDGFDGVADIVADVVDNLHDLDFGGLISDLTHDLGNLATHVISDVGNMVTDVISHVGKTLLDIEQDISKTIVTVAQDLASTVMEVTIHVTQMVIDIFKDHLEVIKAMSLDHVRLLIQYGACLGGQLVYYFVKQTVFLDNAGKKRNHIDMNLLSKLTPNLLTYPRVSYELVRVVTEASLPGNWFRDRDPDPPVGGMTFGNTIYLADKFDPSNKEDIALLAHELVHTAQVVRFLGEDGFGCAYGKGYVDFEGKEIRSYRNNPLEKEAFDFECSMYGVC